MNENTKPETKPSIDFFGLHLNISLFLPGMMPIRYAKVSVIQIRIAMMGINVWSKSLSLNNKPKPSAGYKHANNAPEILAEKPSRLLKNMSFALLNSNNKNMNR